MPTVPLGRLATGASLAFGGQLAIGANRAFGGRLAAGATVAAGRPSAGVPLAARDWAGVALEDQPNTPYSTWRISPVSVLTSRASVSSRTHS